MESKRNDIINILNNLYAKCNDRAIINVLSMIDACQNLDDMDILGIRQTLEEIYSNYHHFYNQEVRLLMSNLMNQIRYESEEIVIYCACGQIIQLVDRICGTCGEEFPVGIFRQEQSRTKWDNTSQHFEETLDSLEGRDKIKIKVEDEEKIFIKVREEMTDKDGILLNISSLSLRDLRETLRTLGMSGYYKNLEAIRQRVFAHFGVVRDGPRFTLQEREILKHLFEKCFVAFNIVKTDEDLLKSINKDRIENIIFYPFLIKQLLPRIMNDDRLKKWDRSIISQSNEATEKHKKIWDKMLSIMDLKDKYEVYDIRYY
jgi:hypothetical protein